MVPNLTLLHAPAHQGAWTPVAASFARVSTNLYQAEVSLSAVSDQSFYRVMMTGQDGMLRIVSSAKAGNRFRVQFEWLH